MSMQRMETHFKFRPFYAILENGLDRIFEVVKSEELQFFCEW
jgi:hypothetical protein